MSVRDTSNKDSGLWLTNAAGRMAVKASCEGYCAYGTYEYLPTKMAARTPLCLYFGRKVATTDLLAVSGTYASGVFYITSWDQTAGQEANATYSVNFGLVSGFAFVSGTAV
jgi:hypothetical protein